MDDFVCLQFEFTILRLYDQVVLGFSDDSSAECREIFKKYEVSALWSLCDNYGVFLYVCRCKGCHHLVYIHVGILEIGT